MDPGPDGEFAATAEPNAAVSLQLSNPHSDITATCSDDTNATGIATQLAREFGVSRETVYQYLRADAPTSAQ